jgi:small GTP-binding protein
MSLIKKKICLLGDVGVGKTSMVRRFVENIFDDSYLSTIGVKVSQKTIPVSSQAEMLLMVWDVEGVSKANAMNSSYLVGASGAIIVVDLTRLQTVELSETLVTTFYQTNPNAAIILAGNKNDLVTPKHPGYVLFKEFAKKLNLPFYFTSAKDGQNIETCFTQLAEKLV